MKKNSIIKAIVITFLIYVLASWVIPSGTIQNGVFTKGKTSPVGISDIFIYPISTSITSIFVLGGLIVLLIGALYGVMNKTGVYTNLVEGSVKKFKGSEKSFLVISILLFAVLASLTTLTLPLLILVPFFVAVILSLGFNKMTAFLSTVGAILVGTMGAIYGYNVDGYNFNNYFFGLKANDNILWKVVLFVLLTTVLIIYVIKTSKIEKAKKSTKKAKEETNEEVIIPLYKKEKASKKSATPLVVVTLLAVVIALIAMFNWNGALEIQKNIFDTWYSNITSVKINDYPLFANLLGSVKAFGLWTNYELAMLLMILMLVIGFIYNLKIKDTFEAAVEGAKEVLPVAAVAILANVLLLVVNSATATFIPTIYNALFTMVKGFNFATMSVAGMIGSIGFSQYPYLLNSLYDPTTALYAKELSETSFILQAMHGFTMMLVPTSVGLVVGLQYLGISYKEWLKDNWRLLLSLLATALIVIIIVTLI